MTTTLSPPFINPDPSYQFYPMSRPGALPPLSSSPGLIEDYPQQAELLKRVLSAGSGGSTPALSTPTMNTAALPLSPGSADVRTPKAKAVGLEAVGGELAHNMDGLKVQSPHHVGVALPYQSFTTGSLGEPQQQGGGEYPISTHARSWSSSTDSTDTHPIPPSQLGSSYGPEGFSIYNNQDVDMAYMNPETFVLSEQAKAAIAQADEAIKQLNGTSTVQTSATVSTPGVQPYVENSLGAENAFAVPRGFADFTKPGEMRTPLDQVHRQSSTSSNVTEASTSSEEEDLCVPSVEWVNIVSSPAHGNYQHSPYLSSPGTAFAKSPAGAGRSPGRMPPPASTRGVTSPRRNPGQLDTKPAAFNRSNLPLGATAHTPGGVNNQSQQQIQSTYLNAPTSALPGGIASNTPAEEDDDTATVGHGRARSPSSSSQSAQSNLDILAQAVTRPPATPAAPTDGALGERSNKGKRKAVAQWRESGIPTGEGSESEDAAGGGKKRRRSGEQVDDGEYIDPSLREFDTQAQLVGQGLAQSGMQDEGAMNESEGYEDEDEGEDANGDEDDGDWGSGKKGKGLGKVNKGVKKAATGGGKAKSSASATNGAGGNKTTGGANGAKKARKSAGSAGGGNGDGAGGSGGGAGKAGEGPSAGVPAGVQCEYVNPLPPYNRCQDFFTRKYDLPRHMARHARREGELVLEGRLPEEKALLWGTIKDKPKVTCAQCGESFTRMDALKRHQAKQHHA